jgi:hypothetical protein
MAEVVFPACVVGSHAQPTPHTNGVLLSWENRQGQRREFGFLQGDRDEVTKAYVLVFGLGNDIDIDKQD